MEISNLLDKEFEIMVIKTLTELEKGVDEHSEVFSKEIENIKMKQSELKNTVTEMKIILEKINNRLKDAEEQINDLEDRVMEIKLDSKKKKEFLKVKIG